MFSLISAPQKVLSFLLSEQVTLSAELHKKRGEILWYLPLICDVIDFSERLYLPRYHTDIAYRLNTHE